MGHMIVSFFPPYPPPPPEHKMTSMCPTDYNCKGEDGLCCWWCDETIPASAYGIPTAFVPDFLIRVVRPMPSEADRSTALSKVSRGGGFITPKEAEAILLNGAWQSIEGGLILYANDTISISDSVVMLVRAHYRVSGVFCSSACTMAHWQESPAWGDPSLKDAYFKEVFGVKAGEIGPIPNIHGLVEFGGSQTKEAFRSAIERASPPRPPGHVSPVWVLRDRQVFYSPASLQN